MSVMVLEMRARETKDRSASWNSLVSETEYNKQIIAIKYDTCFDRGVRRCSVNKDYPNQMRPVF